MMLRPTLKKWFALMMCCCAAAAAAQSPPADPGSPEVRPQIPTVWFQLDWPDADPPSYVIALDSIGHAIYSSQNKAGEPFTAQFSVTEANRKMVFAVAERLRFFQGDFAYKKKIAFTGNKTLTYADPQRRFSTRYNYSLNADVGALTSFFQGISLTAEFDRRLQFMMRYNKLGLYNELTHMLDAANNGWLAEVQITAPRLEAIANDASVMHVARVKASQILAKAGISVSP
jgi:hypothetical protein